MKFVYQDHLVKVKVKVTAAKCICVLFMGSLSSTERQSCCVCRLQTTKRVLGCFHSDMANTWPSVKISNIRLAKAIVVRQSDRLISCVFVVVRKAWKANIRCVL